MQEIRLNDKLYRQAERRALEAGFSSVEAYVADVLDHEFDDSMENIDHLFTPEVIAQLDAISADIKAGGKTYSVAKVNAHFEKEREEWLPGR